MLGTSDRQSIREGDESDRAPVGPLEGPLPEAGRRDRDRFQGARDPRGLDRPAADEEQQDLRTTLVAMNEIYKESVQRNGGAYVDIWPGFVDDENRYTPWTAPMWTASLPSYAPTRAFSSPGPDPEGRSSLPTRRSSGSRAGRNGHGCGPPGEYHARGWLGHTVHRGGDFSSAGRRCTGDSAVEAARGRSCR